MEIKPFKFWCQKVLPLTYDDSLSYYEVLGKMSNKLNEIIKIINTPDKVEDFIINVKDYGAVGDGITDDTVAIQGALNALKEHSAVYFPIGEYKVSRSLIVPVLNDIKLYGHGSSGSIIKTDSLTDSILIVGNINKESVNVRISGLGFDAYHSMTNGSAIELHRVSSWSVIRDIKIGSYSEDYEARIYKGISFKATNVTVLTEFQIRASECGIEISSEGDVLGSDLFINNGFIAWCRLGIHCGGGFGGLYIDNTLIFGGKIGYYESNDLSTKTNREIFISQTVCIDGCDNYLARFNEPNSYGVFVYLGAFLSGSGYYSQDPTERQYASNLSIISSPYSTFSIASQAIKASTGDGIYVEDNTSTLLISNETEISYNGGYGIRIPNITFNIKNNAMLKGNTLGDVYNPHCFKLMTKDYTPSVSCTSGETVIVSEASGNYDFKPDGVYFSCKVTVSGGSGELMIGGLPVGSIEDTVVTGVDITHMKTVTGFIPTGWNNTRLTYSDGTYPSDCTILLKGSYRY